MSVEQAPPRAPLDGLQPSNGTFCEQDWSLLARQWFPVSRADRVVARPRQVTLLDLRLAVYRMADGVHIGRDRCPHRGLQLSTGRIEGDELVCIYHGLRFGADGQCRKAPEKLALKAVDGFRITMFPAVERHGLVWTCLEPQGEPAIPDIHLKTEGFGPTGSDSPFNRLPEDWMDAAKFEFSNGEATIESSHHQSLRDLARSEYQRLFDEMALSTAPHAVQPSRA